MAMKGKMKSDGGGRRRIRSKYEESDASDDDYKIEDDGEFEDSDQYCSSLAGEELEDDLVEDEKEGKVRMTNRLKRRNAFPSKSRGRVRNASKERKVSYKEDSDDDFVDGDANLGEEEDCKDWRTGFPKRKRNWVQKVVQKKKAPFTEENDDEEAEPNDDNDEAEDNNEFEDSDEYCSSLAGEELEDDLAEDEKEEKVRMTGRSKRRNPSPSKSKGRVRKASKERKVSYKEDSDDDYVDDDDNLEEGEDCKDLRMGFPKRKRNRVQKIVQKKKASYTEENDDEEAEDNNDDDSDDINENKEEKDLPISLPSRKQNGVQKALRKKRSAYMEENDDDFEAENYASDDDEDCNDSEDEDLQKGCPSRKQNEVQKALEVKKASYTEEDDDDYEAGDDECDYDEDYVDHEDDLPNGCLRKHQKALKKKNDLCTEENDGDYEVEDEFNDKDDYNDNKNEKDLENGCSSRKQNGVQKALKKKKASCMEENDEDYQAEDDDCNNDDDYENEEEELEEEDDDDDFTPNEIDFDDEDEFAVVKKAKKVRGTSFSRGWKRKRNSRVISKSKKKKPARRRGMANKSSSVRRKEAATKGKSKMKETKERSSGSKRRRLVVDSDSDFADSEQLLLCQDYTISEEEREQVREASKFCGRLDVALRDSSSKKRSREEENLHQERKIKVRKGKAKVEDSKNAAAAKQVCGICFSDEGKRTVRGTLDCCSHYFCFNCIMEWSKVESRCPLCKQRFVTICKPACDLRTIVIPVPERDQVYQPSEEEIRSYIDPYENVICTECHHGGDDANMLLCDLCDSPAHTYCVGLSEVPEGNWYCEGCRPTVLTPSNPQAPNFSRDRRTTNDLSARSSPSENAREAIDLNRVYEPETPVAEGTGIYVSPRPADGDLRAGSLTQGVGVQTVSERRRRHQQIAQFVGRTGVRLGPEVEWARTGRLVSQNSFQNSVNRPGTSSFQNTFSQGLLHDNFASSFQNSFQNSAIRPVPTMRPLSATPSHSGSGGYRVWVPTLTGVNNGSADASGSLQAGLAWPFHGHSPMQ